MRYGERGNREPRDRMWCAQLIAGPSWDPRYSRAINTVRDILEAIRALPRPDRLRLAEELQQQLQDESELSPEPELSEGSQLELRNGFYVYKGSIAQDAVDHRLARDERIDQLIGRMDAGRG